MVCGHGRIRFSLHPMTRGRVCPMASLYLDCCHCGGIGHGEKMSRMSFGGVYLSACPNFDSMSEDLLVDDDGAILG